MRFWPKKKTNQEMAEALHQREREEAAYPLGELLLEEYRQKVIRVEQVLVLSILVAHFCVYDDATRSYVPSGRGTLGADEFEEMKEQMRE